MAIAVYEIMPRDEKWFVLHDGDEAGPYLSSEAALVATTSAASASLMDGLGVEIRVQPGIKAPASPREGGL
jgi:hypothetical protein